MRYRPLGSTGLLVSEVSLGTAALGLDYGFRESAHYAVPSEDEVHRILRCAVELGVNLFDTARAYGDAEARIGSALATLSPRPLIATKFAAVDRAGIITSVETSLRTLRVETIDLLQIHNATRAVLHAGEVLEALEELKEQGKIRFAGASIYELPDAEAAAACLPLSTLQAPFNMLDQSVMPLLAHGGQRRRVGMIIRSAFLRGVLTERIHDVPHPLAPLRDRALAMLHALGEPVERLSELALRFCLSHEAVSTVLLGVRSEQELRLNIAAAEQPPLPAPMLQQIASFSGNDDPLTKPTAWVGLI